MGRRVVLAASPYNLRRAEGCWWPRLAARPMWRMSAASAQTVLLTTGPKTYAKPFATGRPESSSEEATRKNLREFYKMAIPADSVARAIAYAIEQPAEVEIDEVVIRPTALDF